MSTTDSNDVDSPRAALPAPIERARALPRPARLLKPADFKLVFAEGKRIRSEHLRLHHRPNGLAHARLGLAVPKRCLALATRRNRARRLLREAFRRRLQLLPPVDLVFLMTSAPPLPLGNDFSCQIERLFERLLGTTSH